MGLLGAAALMFSLMASTLVEPVEGGGAVPVEDIGPGVRGVEMVWTGVEEEQEELRRPIFRTKAWESLLNQHTHRPITSVLRNNSAIAHCYDAAALQAKQVTLLRPSIFTSVALLY